MSTIVTRAGKGSALTHNEVDANFVNLNTDKYQSGDNASLGTIAGTSITSSALTSGRVTFASTGGLLADNSTFVWDNTNARLGIGIASPTAKLTVQETATSGTNVSVTQLFTASGGYFSIECSDLSASVPNWTIKTGNNEQLIFSTTTAERMRIDSGGNLGLGVTPSAWVAASWRVLQIGSGASIAGRVVAGTEDQIYVSANAYNDGAWKYIATGNATNYYQDNGEHVWRTAPSGTAGNAITFTQAMTLSASGNLGVGNSSPVYRLDCSDSNNSGVSYVFRNRDTGSGSKPVRLYLSAADTIGNDKIVAAVETAGYSGNYVDSYLNFYTQRAGTLTKAMTLDASGNLGIGRTPTTVLDVYNSAGNSVIAQFSSSATNRSFIISQFAVSGSNSAGTDLNASGVGNVNGTLTLSTNSAERMRLHRTGGVSIGNTTDPGASNLSVSGAVQANFNYADTGVASYGSGTSFTLTVSDTTEGAMYLISVSRHTTSTAATNRVSLLTYKTTGTVLTDIVANANITIAVSGTTITVTGVGTASLYGSVLGLRN